MASQEVFSQNPFLKKILNHIGDELMLIDKDGRIVYANLSTRKGLGYRKGELIGKPITAFLSPPLSIREWKRRYFSRLKAKAGQPFHWVLERKIKSGQTQTIEITAEYITYQNKEYILSVARNITERLRLEKDLKGAKDRYRLLAEAAADGIFTADKKGKITYANHALVDMVKFPLSKTKKIHFQRFVDKKTKALALSCFRLALKGIINIREEFVIRNAQGKKIPVEAHISPIFKSGEVVGVHAIVRDISDRKHMDALIRESERRYRDLFEESTDALVVTDTQSIILEANRQMERLLARKRDEIVRTPIRNYFSQSSIKGWDDFFSEVLHGKGASPMDLKVVNAFGREILVAVTARCLRSSGKETILIRLSDLTDRLKVEEQIQEAKKMEAMNLFIRGTAQEIRNPLRVILRHTQRMVKEYKEREFEYISYREFRDIIMTIDKINEQVSRCCQITDRLLSLQQKEIPKAYKECQANNVLREIITRQEGRLLASNIRVVLRLQERLPAAAIVPFEFQQIAENIINNSIQAMPSGGTITIRSTVTDEKKRIKIEFCDEGVGMTKSVLPRIFDPFFSAKQGEGGQSIGLGLTIVNAILQAVGGTISISSSLRKGTVVTIWLPAVVKKKESKLQKKKKSRAKVVA